MSLLPNLRARLKGAFEEHAAEWRPGGTPHPAAAARDIGAEFLPDEEVRREAASRPAPRPAAVRPSPAASVRSADAPTRPQAKLAARLRSPGALREAFVVKEILDRPVGLRPMRGLGVRG